MEIPLPSVATLLTLWEWIKRNLEILLKIFHDPKSLLAPIDFDDFSSLVDALQFAIFPIAATIAIDLPGYLMRKDAALSFSSFIIIDLIEGCGIIVLLVASQRIATAVVRGSGKLNACFVATLYATAFIPFAELSNYFVVQWQPKIVPERIDLGDSQIDKLILMLAYGLILLVLVGVISVFTLTRLVTITKLAHRVGLTRALLIVVVTVLIGTPLTVLFAAPFEKITTGYDMFSAMNGLLATGQTRPP